ncbi:unnamed protein product [Ectocarpus fasciculatus]
MIPSVRKAGSLLALKNAGMRRGCLECARRKKKCDGLTPCSWCLGAGVRCTYSKRKWHQPQPGDQQHPRGPAVTMPSMESSPGALPARGVLPLKRCRLSASPATGLVGMLENAFLSDFFGCIGFLPLTTPSHIRGAMVRIMTRSSAQQQPSETHESPEQSPIGVISAEGGIGAGHQLSIGPSACTFWCAVGMGALVKGTPVERVANYCCLARDALDAYDGPVNTESAEAYASLGLFLGFMGDTAKYGEYQKLSGSFLATSIEQGSADMLPLGFAELVCQKASVHLHLFSGDLDTPDTDVSLATRCQHPPKIEPALGEGDMYRYVVQSLTGFMEFVFERACENRATCRYSRDDEPGEEDISGASPHVKAPRVEEISEVMATGIKEGLIDFDLLQEAVDRRPHIRMGIGSLLINMTLGYQRASRGDASGTLERFRRCVEVFERYPGVCCCMLQWCHLAHGVLGSLAAIDDSRARGLYDRLREVYNRWRHSASLPAPPLEEWRGISAFCDDFQCRLYDGAIASQALSVFSAPPYGTSSCMPDSSHGSESAACR